MSKVTILTKPNRIVIASKGVQGPPGPEGQEGIQGIQGEKGDTGDVTPEALAARDAAVDAADAASQSADAAAASENTASAKADEAAASADLAEQAQLLGATIGFATKSDMDASLAHPDGTLALVTSDPTPANNGTYRKTGASGSGSWVQSADRVTGLEGRVSATEAVLPPLLDIADAVIPASPGDDIAAIVDAEGRVMFRVGGDGQISGGLGEIPQVESASDLVKITAAISPAAGGQDIAAITDADGRVALGIRQDGTIYGGLGEVQQGAGAAGSGTGSVSAYERRALPYLRGQSVAIVGDSVISGAIQHTTTIYGYEDPITGIPRTKVVSNGSLTHPKVLHIPAGWNGYSYWMAATPYFGDSWGDESENPHILASNDGVNFQEIPDGPLDIAPSAPSYYSDTHLTLGADDYLYCTYRASGPMTGGGSRHYMRRSRNGRVWSERVDLGPVQLGVSPVIEPAPQGGYDYFEVRDAAYPIGIRRLWLPALGGPLPDRNSAELVEIATRPWESEYPGLTLNLWHFDAARVGNIWLGVMVVRGDGVSTHNYLAWSPDGWTWHALPGAIGTSHYRSSIVPVSFYGNRVVADVYLAARTGGIISVRRFTLEVS